MSSMSTATMPINRSRPKVHRLPVPAAGKHSKKTPLPGFLLFWGVSLVALIALSVSLKKDPVKEMVVKEATLLPPVAVVSKRIAPAPSLMDAQAATSDMSDKSGSVIRLKDGSGAIVGQMAKIPLENEPITEVKAINDVDNGGGRELLSIVGKY